MILASFIDEKLASTLKRVVWEYSAVGTIHGASGVCMRCMRRYGFLWLVVSDRSCLSWVSHCRTIRLYVC